MRLLLTLMSTVALIGLLVPIAADAASSASEPALAGTPRLYAVRGDIAPGRPTRYVTFKTVKGINARSLVVTVSESSGRTFNADNGRRGEPRTCFRSAMAPYQRAPAPRRLKPGVLYKVRFYVRTSLNGERMLFSTRTLRARSFQAETKPVGGSSAPSPCRR